MQGVQEMRVQSLGWEDPLEEGMATLIFLLGESPWREEPGGLESMGSQRVRNDLETKQQQQQHTHTHIHTHTLIYS